MSDRNKKIIEEYYNNFKKRKNMKLVTVRMCTAIGPLYHKKGGVVSLLANAKIMAKLNNRYCELQFLHEDDLIALMNKIVKDSKIEGTFNLAPDSYSTTKELVFSNKFIPLPLFLIRGIIRILWGLRVVGMRAAAMTLSTYGIIVDPHKLMKRYNYKFKYSTYSGYMDTVKKRRKKGTKI